jgi:hypothetical protein
MPHHRARSHSPRQPPLYADFPNGIAHTRGAARVLACDRIAPLILPLGVYIEDTGQTQLNAVRDDLWSMNTHYCL